jgi:hypothetical protein
MRIFALLFLPLLILSTRPYDLQAQAGPRVSLKTALESLNGRRSIQISFDPASVAPYLVAPPPRAAKTTLKSLQNLLRGLPFVADSVESGQFVIKPHPNFKVKPTRKLTVKVWGDPEGNGSSLQLLTGASVYYLVPGSKPEGNYTNAYGEVIFNFPAGSYFPDTIHVRMLNYMPYKIAAAGTPLQVLLKPAIIDIVRIEDHASAGHELPLPPLWSVQDRLPRSLKHFPSPGGNDPAASLALSPGISSQDETPGQISIRGGTPDQSLVQLDGITLYSNSHIPSAVGRVPGHVVRDTRVILGGMPVRYGNRLSGVIEFLGQPVHDLNKQNNDKAGATVGMDLLSAFGHGRFASKEGNASFFVSARRSLTDVLPPAFSAPLLEQQLQRGILFRDQPSSQGGEAEYPRFRFYDLYAKSVITEGEKDVVNITLFGAHDALRYQRPAGGLPNSARDSLAFGQWGSSIRWDRNWNATLNSTFQISYTRFASQYDYRYSLPEAALLSRYRQQSELSDFSFQQEHSILLGDSSVFAFGIQGAWLSAFYQQANQEQYGIYQQRDSSGGFARGGLYTLFAEHRREVLKKVNLSVGSRISYYTATQRLYPEPRLALSWQAAKQLLVSVRSGMYWQFTSRALQLQDLGIGEELWMLAGQDSLRPSRAQDLIAGLALSAGESWVFRLDAYARQQQDIAVYDLEFDPLTLETKPSTDRRYQGEARILGLDATVEFHRKNHQAWVSYTLSKVSQRFDEIAEGQAFAAGHDQRHRIKAAHYWQIGQRWGLASSWMLASGAPYTEVSGFTRAAFHGRELFFIDFSARNTGRLPAYHRLNLSIRRNIQPRRSTWSAVCGLALNNVYDRRNVQARRFWVARNEAGSLKLQGENIRLAGLTPSFFIQFSL